ETEHPMLLRVREGKEFREVDPANLTDELIKELAGIAAADPTKRYYIELLAYESLAKACFTSMCFAEFEGSVILNEISIDSQMLDDFDAEADCVSGYYYGLWVPYDFKRRIGICIPEDYETNGPPHRRSNEHKPDSHQHRS
ncbi:hypothetical protein KY362_07180, partial [Candidatus Woesearchaeota archaeon]|nr:hypothetical protein [Candidatus Woesearchaeota archaeon]